MEINSYLFKFSVQAELNGKTGNPSESKILFCICFI